MLFSGSGHPSARCVIVARNIFYLLHTWITFLQLSMTRWNADRFDRGRWNMTGTGFGPIGFGRSADLTESPPHDEQRAWMSNSRTPPQSKQNHAS